MTNGDWLRAQGDDEMAVFIMVVFIRNASARREGKSVSMTDIIDWLKEEHEEGR